MLVHFCGLEVSEFIKINPVVSRQRDEKPLFGITHLSIPSLEWQCLSYEVNMIGVGGGWGF